MEVKISITVKIPEALKNKITKAQIQEWAEFRTGYRGDMKADNPLCDEDLEAIRCWIN